MAYKTLDFTVAENIATITLNRPDDANALDAKMADELLEVAIECSTREDVRAVILTGKGRMFCPGGDLKEFKAVGNKKEAHLIKMATIMHAAIVRFSNMEAPLIVAVNGTAGGGGFSLALSGDVILASNKAKFVSAYTASGLTPDGSSTFFLAKHIGLLRAKEMIFTNRVLSADEACNWGLVSRVVEPESLMTAAMELATAFATGPTKAYGQVKKLLNTAFNEPMEAQLEKEAQGISGMMKTRDAPHGLEAFLNKEKPKFEGR
ncbi:MAG: enoyl-CoA hydratase/isomerase family protein [Rhizobiaceae bacterium]